MRGKSEFSEQAQVLEMSCLMTEWNNKLLDDHQKFYKELLVAFRHDPEDAAALISERTQLFQS
jgi:hypothetical protein